ncbi:CdaR family protein [Staphylococcus gallinarum]|uniref:YbbR-like domain-containing protein n=1 Tax=Staphylococcus gallinarum TaxID=1293 RepID=A0A418HL95_STAGA|nr:CdaR family protein [Staphylococcus gallinarum]MCD8827616.1 YbbR-like domain-containing protein [Staphylococcus gallinarum]RIL41711.1 YbbR-like domain-containing protein [Staphylococcus gallinarum]RIO95489.1 YbbR-like domain-containing protein [Staphylococcus gallinarum]
MLESKWGLRLIALVLAVVFFLSANNMFGNIFDADHFGQKSNDTLQEVPVQVKYDNKSLYASDVPDKVDVEISGPQSQVLKAENAENVRAVLDFTGEKAGKHTAQFKVNGLSEDIDYNVKPKEATVSLEKKVSKNLKVEPDVSNSDLDSDYKVSSQKVSPDTVKVTGGQEQIDKIAYLKATYKNKSKISKNLTDAATITAFDRNLNKVKVSIEPKEVNLTVKVTDYSKKVKVRPQTTGELPDNLKLDDIDLEDKEIEIYGNREDLDDINSVKAEINLDNITESTKKNIKLKIPDSVTKASSQETTADITVK